MLLPSMMEAPRDMSAVTSANPAGNRGSASVGRSPDVLLEDSASLRLVVRAVVAHVLGQSQRHPDVEDCTQVALTRAIEGKGRLRQGEPLRPWVLGIARHVAIDWLRSNRRARKRAAHDDPAGEQAPLVDQVVDPTPGPEDRAELAQRAGRVTALLETFAPEQRQALVLFHVEGLRYQAIAERLGVPLGTVATWIARGRKSIAEALGERGEQTP